MACCCGGCPCCPGWDQAVSGSIQWSAVADASDCGGGSNTPGVEAFGCIGAPEDETGTLLLSLDTDLYVRVWCDYETLEWHVQYRSGTTGVDDCESPASTTWLEVANDFVCPNCDDAIDGIAYGTIDFIAVMCCEISGPTIVTFNVTVHADIEIPCE